MTGTLAPTIPTIGDPNATEDADVRSALVTLRDGINAVLTSANKLDGAQIGAGTLQSAGFTANTLALAKLVNGTSAQALIADASGVWTARSLTADPTGQAFSISNTGVVTIPPVPNAKLNLTTTTVNGSAVILSASYQDIAVATTPAAGTYIVFASVIANGAGGTTQLNGRLARAAVSNGPTPQTDIGSTTSKFSTLAWTHVITLDGTQNLSLQAKTDNTGNSSTDSRLILLRIA
jgi:hypothetical protein